MKRATMAGDVIEVAAGLVFREGKLLITQRCAGSHLAGLWEFPGGKRACDESFEACLERELREELGIEIGGIRWLAGVRHEYAEKKVLLMFYRCGWRAVEPRALGCASWRWVGKEELGEYEFPGADARLLDRVRTDEALWL